MNRYLKLSGGILFALASELFITPSTLQPQSALGPLHLRDALPDVIGQSLSGGPAHLSTVVSGKIAVVVFSFSKAGGKDTQLWDKSLLRDLGSNPSVTLSTVIMLESAPRLLRGVIVSGIKNSIPPSLHSRTIVSYENEQLWKERLGVANDSHAYVLLLGQDGSIRWMNSGAFSDTQYKELTTKIQDRVL